VRTFTKEMEANNVRSDNETIRYLRTSMEDMPVEQREALLNIIVVDKSLNDNWVMIHKHYMAANNQRSTQARKQFRNLRINDGESLSLFQMRAEQLYDQQFLKNGNIGTNDHVVFMHDLIKRHRLPVAQAAASQHHQSNKDDVYGLDGLNYGAFWTLMISTEATIGIPAIALSLSKGSDKGDDIPSSKRVKGADGKPKPVKADAELAVVGRAANNASKPCHLFGSGNCQYGDKCKFSHDPNKTRTRDAAECRNFKAGTCQHGDSCRYKHTATTGAY
jgi:hypothetical protein